VLVTSLDRRGYDAVENVYYADPADLDEMRAALRTRAGTRVPVRDTAKATWDSIAQEHVGVYEAQIATRTGKRANS
jgi:hypothetical protein